MVHAAVNTVTTLHLQVNAISLFSDFQIHAMSTRHGAINEKQRLSTWEMDRAEWPAVQATHQTENTGQWTLRKMAWSSPHNLKQWTCCQIHTYVLTTTVRPTQLAMKRLNQHAQHNCTWCKTRARRTGKKHEDRLGKMEVWDDSTGGRCALPRMRQQPTVMMPMTAEPSLVLPPSLSLSLLPLLITDSASAWLAWRTPTAHMASTPAAAMITLAHYATAKDPGLQHGGREGKLRCITGSVLLDAKLGFSL